MRSGVHKVLGVFQRIAISQGATGLWGTDTAVMQIRLRREY